MRRAGLACFTVFAFALPAHAEDCSKDVLAAVEKQRTSKAFRVSMVQPTVEGPVKMTVDYLPPDRMLQTVTADHMPGEQHTMLVGTRAFAGSGGGYEELLPHLAQSVVTEMKAAVGKPENVGTFECAGKQSFEGKDYLAYRAVDKEAKPGTPPDEVLARTIYVDEVTGLPAYNVVATVSGKAPPVMKVEYSYPADVVIEAPANAPVQKAPH